MVGERGTAMGKSMKWDALTIALIVMQELEGTPVGDIYDLSREFSESLIT
jgi:hypothetical protein